jgi:hypothetical protein
MRKEMNMERKRKERRMKPSHGIPELDKVDDGFKVVNHSKSLVIKHCS